MKKRTISIICLILCLSILMQPVIGLAQRPGISASAGIVLDHDTGDVLYSKDPDTMRVPASMTKILTTYIIYEEIEAGNLTKDTMIKVSPHAARISRDNSYPMSVPLKSGGSYSVDQFIKLIMIPSASASCIAVAEHISGSEWAFVQRMNKTAKDLGLQTNFKNSHGAKPHYTTARSLAKLVSHFIDTYPDILNYTSLKSITFGGRTYGIFNRFIAVDRYEGADGFKTGTIPQAGYCLAATAKRDGRRIISIVMNSSSNNQRYIDSRRMLDFGFKEVKRLDKVRNETKLTFENPPKEIRLNSDFNLRVKASNLSRSYLSTGGWTVNGKAIDKVYRNRITNGKSFDFSHYTNDANAESIEVGFYLDLPNGKKKEVKTTLKISDKEPALYRDINKSWIEDEVVKLSKHDILNGVSTEYFGSTQNVNRGMFVTVLGRLAEHFELDEIKNIDSKFKDVKSDSCYSKYIAWADELGFISGYGENFGPNGAISREAAVSVLNKFFDHYEIELPLLEDRTFNDADQIQAWAKTAVEKISAANIMTSINDGTFNPKGDISRAHLAYILGQSFDIIEDGIENLEEDLDIKDDLDEKNEVDKEESEDEEELKDKEVEIKDEEKDNDDNKSINSKENNDNEKLKEDKKENEDDTEELEKAS